MQDELLDIVDVNDQVIGQMLRSQVRERGMVNYRAVNAFIINDQGQLWIPRRTEQKKVYPLCLDASVSGCVSAGETYDQGFAREAQEEVGVDIHTIPYTCIGLLNPYQHGTKAFMHVYLIRSNQVPLYNPDDYIDYYWLRPEQVLERIVQGDKTKHDLPVIIKQLFDTLV